MKYYAVDLRKGYVAHEGTQAECWRYTTNATYLHDNVGPYRVVKGAKARDVLLKLVRTGRPIVGSFVR